MIPLTRFTSGNYAIHPVSCGEYVLATDVEKLIHEMEARHKLAMQRKFNTMGTISGRLVSRAGSPGTIDKAKFADDVSKVVSYRRALDQSKRVNVERASDSLRRIMRNLKGDTIQFEELEL